MFIGKLVIMGRSIAKIKKIKELQSMLQLSQKLIPYSKLDIFKVDIILDLFMILFLISF